ncbi:MAG: helicase-related protein, partial [Planctomycetia bacterium]
MPIDDALPAALAALAKVGVVVLRAPTGAGKTTRVPPALFDAGLVDPSRGIVMLEPRRIAARSAAGRIAYERGVRLGAEVGYEVRFDRKRSAATLLTVVTEGVFLRQLQDDPYLEALGAVVFDEFHERNLASDLALAMTMKVRREVRPDLKVVVMSATLEVPRLAEYLCDAPVIDSLGRTHPVSVVYEPPPVGDRRLEGPTAAAVERLLDQTPGDLLVFLPGVGEIKRTASLLEPVAARAGINLCELFGDLPPEKQDAVLRRGPRRKIVLSTNVAETSVTIEGVTGVVDVGLARVLRYDPAVGLDRLELEKISRASADQRAGRAGRTAPGVCVR